MSRSCQALHNLTASCVRHRFPYRNEAIPSNGIYLLFESREFSHGRDRIVCVGSHTGDDRLQSRLEEHFVNENKDRSIFRRNIGRALLAKSDDPFLEDWELDLTTRMERQLNARRIDREKQAEIESQVTSYIRAAFSFVVLPIQTKQERITAKSKIISTLSWCEECGPSSNWFGKYSPVEKIRQSGLWLVQGLYKEPLLDEDLHHLTEIAGQN